jgi:hypothetical protein
MEWSSSIPKSGIRYYIVLFDFHPLTKVVNGTDRKVDRCSALNPWTRGARVVYAAYDGTSRLEAVQL